MIEVPFRRQAARAAGLVGILLTATFANASAQTNTINATAPATCITPQHTCTTVPITIARTDVTPVLAFSVTFSLSSNLALCTPSLTGDITEGDYLHQASPNTSFQVRDRGNGSYTADGVILGQENCGSIGASGALFNVRVTNTGGSGTGTVTLTSVTLRNCSNATLASILGSAANVTIDLAPVTVAPISSPQSVTENSLLTITPAATISACATGPATWTVAPALPSGATFSATTGQIQWTPACGTAGNYGPFTLTATAASGEFASSNAFTIHVAHLVGTVTVAAISSPQNVTENSLLTITPSASTTPCVATPLTWSVAPALPAGATFSSSTGQVQWTPACGTAGNYGPFTLTATSPSGEVGSSNAFTIVVAHLVGTVTVAAISTPQNVTENSLLTITPSASTTPCVASPLTWSVAPPLPSGATFSSSTGQIQWTPTCGTAGNYGPFTLTATSPSGEVGSSNAFAIHVAHLVGTVTVAAISTPQPVVESSTLTITPSASTTPCVATPLTWSVAPALPAGATFSSATGQIQWTPACGTAGNYGPFTLTATSPSGEVGSSNAFTIVVAHLVGTVTVAAISSPQNVTENSSLTITPSASTTACVATPLTWSVAPPLPSGATFSSSTGQIQWTPACGTAGNYGPFTLTATSPSGEVGSSNAFAIHVAHLVGTVTVAAISTPQPVVESSTLTITPSAGTTPCAGAPLTWSVSPALPAGATFSSSTGQIQWTPDCAAAEGGASGTYGPFTLTAQAATGEQGSSNAFSIHVTDTPTVAAAVSALAATPVPVTAAGNGLLGLTVTFTAPGGATSIEVYRAPYGNYPEYDDAPNAGAAPTAPTYPPSGPWVLTAVTASGQVDQPPTRDVWYYVAFAHNACGDVSPASTLTSGTLDYLLGDVTDGHVVGTGNNIVNTADISVLGSHYGLTGPAMLAFDYLDVGPTSTGWVDGRPLTDDRIDFEDLVIFAINYHPLTAAKIARHQTASEGPAGELVLSAPAHVEPGAPVTAELAWNGSGAVCGLSTKLSWDAAVVEPIAHVAGDGLLAQGGAAFSPAPGVVDAVALESGTLTGAGTLARVTFRVLTGGDPRIRIDSVDGRDLANRKVGVTVSVDAVGPRVPVVTQLAPIAPNPAQGSARIAWSLAHAGPVDIAVYAVNGRRLATLVHGSLAAGDYSRAWDGKDDAGHAVGAGVYYVHMVSAGQRFTRTVAYLK